MKKYTSILRYFFILFAALTLASCVHDDKYDTPDLNGYKCGELTPTMTLADAKNLPQNTTITSDAIIEGYVSSSDESGNIYKTIYLQNAPENPTHGFVISIDAVSTYAQFSQGSKVYVKLKGLAMGTYGGVKQLGYMTGSSFGRIPEAKVSGALLRSCAAATEMKPLPMTLQGMPGKEALIGALIVVPDAEFDAKNLCSVFAPDGVSVDRQINDPTMSSTTRVVRNSGFASFANNMMPSGKGNLIGVLSKFNNTWQIYLNRLADVADMTKFPRKDGIAADPCTPASMGTEMTIAQAKTLHTTGAFQQITADAYIKGIVTANDQTGNLYKYFYIEDATGGIKVNVNKTNLYQDPRFIVGNELKIKLKDLYIGNRNGEIQLGGLFNGNLGNLEENQMYKHFFDTATPIQNVIPTERTITQLTQSDIGRWIKIKNVQFIDSELGQAYAPGNFAQNRTLEDCAGNTIKLRTSNFADFAKVHVDEGNGDIYAILSYFVPTNGNPPEYQLWIPKQVHADFDNNRCDGTAPAVAIFNETFSGTLAGWYNVSKSGAQVWNIQNFGNPAPCVVMSGYDGGNFENEDWLISKPISLNNYSQATLSFESDRNYGGDDIIVYATDNYTGDPATTNWVQLPAILDTQGGFGQWVNSGNISLNQFLNKNVSIAFKYTSTAMDGATWEIDNVKIVAK